MNLVDRIKYTLFEPQQPPWAGVKTEPLTSTEAPVSTKPAIANATILGALLAMLLVALLATFPPVSAFIFGHRFADISLGTLTARVITGMIVGCTLSLGGAYLLARIIDALAPKFGGTKNMNQALRVAIISTSAFWLAHVISMMTGLRFIELIGLYGIYALYAGLPVSMKLPKTEAIPYANIIVIVAIAISLAVCGVQAVVTGGTCF